MNIPLRIALVCAAACTLTAASHAASTAFRLSDLDLRDPHLLLSFLGCRDITDVALAGLTVNGDLQTRIQTDALSDGLLDLSLLIVFDPLDPSAPGSAMRFGESSCTAPLAGTACGPSPYENLAALSSTNAGSGQCLGPLAGTTHGYTPAVTTPTGPCFASDELGVYVVNLFGGQIPLTLHHVRVAAGYSGGPPASNLVTGLLRGFLTEADANATIIASTFPLAGGQPISSLLPGGSLSCAAYSDKDVGPAGESGWWFYFNFVAAAVPYSGPSVGVGSGTGARLLLAAENPTRAEVRFAYQLDADGPARITIHDLSGRRVAELLNGWQTSGQHQLAWGGRLDQGGTAAPGLYVIRLSSARGTIARKVVLLR